jgi:hypothetical protein
MSEKGIKKSVLQGYYMMHQRRKQQDQWLLSSIASLLPIEGHVRPV